MRRMEADVLAQFLYMHTKSNKMALKNVCLQGLFSVLFNNTFPIVDISIPLCIHTDIGLLN